MIQLSMTSKLPITQQHITDAVSGVLQQHPLLRTILLRTGNVISIVEPTQTSIPLEFMKIREFRCEFNACALENEMWRMVALKSHDEESLELTIMLAHHPVVADFIYTRQIIRDIANNILFAQMGKYWSSNMVSILSDPIEKMIEHVPINRVSPYVDLVGSSTKDVIMAHDAFVLSEIRRGRLNLSSNPSKRLVWKLNKNLSKVIDTSFKSKNGTILAVCAKSFMRLISDTVSAIDVVEMPITFMVNLRRFIDTTTDLNRNGCVESELYLKLDKNSKIADLIFNISQNIYDQVQSGDVLRKVKEDPPSTITRTKVDREVIALSHVGHIDDLIDNKHYTLNDVQFNINTSSDLCPLFNIITYFVRGELYFTVSYCSTIISDETVLMFTTHVKDIMQKLSISY